MTIRSLAGPQKDTPSSAADTLHHPASRTSQPALHPVRCVIKSWTRTCKQKSCTTFQNTFLKTASTCSSPPLGSFLNPVAWEIAGVLASILDLEDKHHFLRSVEQWPGSRLGPKDSEEQNYHSRPELLTLDFYMRRKKEKTTCLLKLFWNSYAESNLISIVLIMSFIDNLHFPFQ